MGSIVFSPVWVSASPPATRAGKPLLSKPAVRFARHLVLPAVVGVIDSTAAMCADWKNVRCSSSGLFSPLRCVASSVQTPAAPVVRLPRTSTRDSPPFSAGQDASFPGTRAHDAVPVGQARVRMASRMEEARGRGAQERGPRALRAGAVQDRTRGGRRPQPRAGVSRAHAPAKSAAVRSMVEASVALRRCGNAKVRAKACAPTYRLCGRPSSCHGAMARPRVTSTGSSSSSARCMAARTSRFCGCGY